jgi:hypothetical protein
VALADDGSGHAFFERRITFSNDLNTLGEIVPPLAAGRAGSGPEAQQYAHHFLHRLEGLALELDRHGLRTRLTAPAGRIPSLHVINPAVSRLAEDVYVGRSQDGRWWFWWPWAERIAAENELALAATLIARVLGVRS